MSGRVPIHFRDSQLLLHRNSLQTLSVHGVPRGLYLFLQFFFLRLDPRVVHQPEIKTGLAPSLFLLVVVNFFIILNLGSVKPQDGVVESYFKLFLFWLFLFNFLIVLSVDKRYE